MRCFPSSFVASLKWLSAAMGAGVLAISIAVFFLPDGYSWRALAAGWLTALANAIAAWWLNRRAMGLGRRPFLRWGVIGNVLRILTLLGILITVISTHRTVRNSFFASFFTGLLVFMTVEIAELFRLDSGKREKT